MDRYVFAKEVVLLVLMAALGCSGGSHRAEVPSVKEAGPDSKSSPAPTKAVKKKVPVKKKEIGGGVSFSAPPSVLRPVLMSSPQPIKPQGLDETILREMNLSLGVAIRDSAGKMQLQRKIEGLYLEYQPGKLLFSDPIIMSHFRLGPEEELVLVGEYRSWRMINVQVKAPSETSLEAIHQWTDKNHSTKRDLHRSYRGMGRN